MSIVSSVHIGKNLNFYVSENRGRIMCNKFSLHVTTKCIKYLYSHVHNVLIYNNNVLFELKSAIETVYAPIIIIINFSYNNIKWKLKHHIDF